MAVAKCIFISKSAPGSKEHCKHTVPSLAYERRKESPFCPEKLTAKGWGHTGDTQGKTEAIAIPQTDKFPINSKLRFSHMMSAWCSTQKQGDRKTPSDKHILMLWSEVGIAPWLVPKKILTNYFSAPSPLPTQPVFRNSSYIVIKFGHIFVMVKGRMEGFV